MIKQKSPYKEGGMFEGANHLVFGFAKQLRKEMTDAEKILWMHLKPGIQNLKFRRQHPIGPYVADFFCHKLKLIIEIDGSIHDLKETKIHDEEREKFLTESGYSVIRFSNRQVHSEIEFILYKINSMIEAELQKQIS